LAEFHHFRIVDQLEKTFRTFDFYRARPREIASVLQGIAHGAKDRRIGMAKTDSPIAHAIFDIFVTIDIEYMRAGAALDEARSQNRILVVALGIGVAATRNKRVCLAGEQLGIAKLRCEKVHAPSPFCSQIMQQTIS